MTKPYQLKFNINSLPKLKNSTNYNNWRAEYGQKMRWHKLVAEATLKYKLPQMPIKFANVMLTRVSSRQPDLDGLAFSFRHIMDSLVKLGILLDDSPNHVNVVYRWTKGERAKGFVTIDISEEEKSQESRAHQTIEGETLSDLWDSAE